LEKVGGGDEGIIRNLSMLQALEALAGAMFPRLCPALDEVAALTYQPSEAEYAAMEAEEAWTARLLLAMEARLAWLRPMLIPAAYDGLVAHLVDKVLPLPPAVPYSRSKYPFGSFNSLSETTRLYVESFS
jgi:hypothetical protein